MNKILNKAVTARFSNEDYICLQTEAEERGCTVADVIRGSWTHYQEQKKLQQLLLKMEQRQRKFQFELLSVFFESSDEELNHMKDTLKAKGVKF